MSERLRRGTAVGIITLLIALGCCGCRLQSRVPAHVAASNPGSGKGRQIKGGLTPIQARATADSFARKAGIDLNKFEEPEVDLSSDGRSYVFLYTLKGPGRPGGHFAMYVDLDGKVTLQGGA